MVALLFPPAVMTFTFNNSEVLMCAVLYVDTLSQIQTVFTWMTVLTELITFCLCCSDECMYKMY